MPLEPPWTSKVSPCCRRPRSNTLLHTVKKVSGSVAASTSLKPLGTGRHCADRRDAQLGIAAAGDQRADAVADLEAGVRQRRASPATISPATSRPGRSDAPGGTG